MPTKQRAKPKTTNKRSAPIPGDKWFYPSWYYWAPTAAGVEVTEDTARRFSAVWACVKAISETLATIPLLTYRRLPKGAKERLDDDRVSRLLRHRPNRWQTSFTFRQFMFAHVLAWGNAYAEVVRDERGDPSELKIIHPGRVTAKMSDRGELFFEVPGDQPGSKRVIFKRDMFHILGPTDDGVTGLSPIAAHREGIGLGMAAESFGAAFFGNGATPAAVIHYPGHLDQKDVDDFKLKMEQLYQGPKKAGKTAVLTSGMELKSVGIPQKDAQYLELRRFQVEEVARIYRVPLYKLQDHTHSTFSNIEHLAIEWVSDCLMPWARRFEEAVLRDLYNPEADVDTFDDSVFAEFLFEGLLRGDTVSRYQAYAVGRQWGWLSVNDVRSRENLNPIGPEGDMYLQPLNMVPAGTEQEEPDDDEEDSGPPETEGADGGESTDGQEDDEAERVRAAFRPLLLDAWERVVRKEVGAVKTAARKLPDGEVDNWRVEFLDELEDFARNCLRSSILAYGQLRGSWDPTDALVRVTREYREEVSGAIDAYRAATPPPARTVAHIAAYWTDRVLSYPDGSYEQTA